MRLLLCALLLAGCSNGDPDTATADTEAPETTTEATAPPTAPETTAAPTTTVPAPPYPCTGTEYVIAEWDDTGYIVEGEPERTPWAPGAEPGTLLGLERTCGVILTAATFAEGLGLGE